MLYRVVGCLLFWGCLSIEVNERTVGTFHKHLLYSRCPLGSTGTVANCHYLCLLCTTLVMSA